MFMYLTILLLMTFACLNAQSTDGSVCRDKIDNCATYGQTTCSKFQQWAQQNCPAYCQFCVAPPTTPVPCVDKIGNCQDYGSTVCHNPLYAPWVLDNCRYYCRQCTDDQLANADSKTTTLPPPPCVDKLTNCGRYGQTACTSYKPWAQDNCRLFCRYCTQDQLAIADSKTTTTTNDQLANADSKTTTLPPPPCVDKLTNCGRYGQTACTSYKPWAQDNCRLFCRYCTQEQLAIADSKTTTTTTPPTTPVPCVDKIGNCQDYGATVCDIPVYAPWVLDNCRYYCRHCTEEQLAIADSKTTTKTSLLHHCTSDADCSTHQCTGNLRYAYCHDFSSCDCGECSEDSHCQCQSGFTPQCQHTTNTCQCNQMGNLVG